jgi:hypothetical protein
MRVGTTQNVLTNTVTSVEALDVWSTAPGTTTLYVDVNRSDGYVADGSLAHPFKTLAAAVTRTTNATTTFQTQVTLATGALTGTYRISWGAAVDHSNVGTLAEVRLYNVTDGVVVGAVRRFKPNSTDSVWSQCGMYSVTLAGVSKTYAIQFRPETVGTTGCADAHIEFFQVAP